jgi:hypothetical protein
MGRSSFNVDAMSAQPLSPVLYFRHRRDHPMTALAGTPLNPRFPAGVHDIVTGFGEYQMLFYGWLRYQLIA